MSTNPNIINYIVTYDSDINSETPIYLGPLMNVEFLRNIAPSEDSATIELAGIGYTVGGQTYPVESAREIYIYRQNSDDTTTLKFRGMTTNPTYSVDSSGGLTTTIQVNSLWYMLSTRLFAIAGKSPPPYQPNTNPYLVYLNPTLGLRFGQLWADIVINAFQGSYGTGHLPIFQLANFTDTGILNPDIPQGFTDFDNVIVNDNLNVQYVSISAMLDRLVTSALFSPGDDQPFLAEYRLDIGDFPYGSWPDTVQPLYPTVTVMLFDPTHSKLGNGNNRTGLPMGDNSLDPYGTDSDELQFPMSYVEFGVTNGYTPIDTVVFTEGDNIVSLSLTYDYLSMNNSYVLTGGSFLGSDIVALPINNQRSIAEYGLKQTNQALNNVVDQAEIQRYVGTSINFFQHPIPNITVVPDYVYASSHILYAGDYVLLNTPSLAGVVTDSNGNVLKGTYQPGDTEPIAVNAYTARIKTIDISWNPDDGEAITLTFTFPITNVPIIEWNIVNDTQYNGANAGGQQFMYTSVVPAVNTVIGKGRNQEGAALYQAGGDFFSNRNNPISETVTDGTFSEVIVPDAEFYPVPMFAQIVPNLLSTVTTSYAEVYTNGETQWVAGPTTKGDGVQIFQLGFEIDTVNSSTINTNIVPSDTAASPPNDVYLTIVQPDGMAIFDSILPLNQAVNILTLISQSHTSLGTVLYSGTASGSTSTVLTDDTQDWVPNSVAGNILYYTSGPADYYTTGQSRIITSNTSDTLTTGAFSPAPDADDDTYQIRTSSSALIGMPSGLYMFIFRNSRAFSWTPNPLFVSSGLAAPTATGGVAGISVTYAYIYCPVFYDTTGDFYYESGMSPLGGALEATAGFHVTVTWPSVSGAVTYNVYQAGFPVPPFPPAIDMLAFTYVGHSNTIGDPVLTTFTDAGSSSVPNTQPFDTPNFYNGSDYFISPTGFICYYSGTPAGGGTYFNDGDYYWYMITANNPENIESESSQAATPYTNTTDNSVSQPDANQVAQGASPQTIELSWPAVPNAISYNIYRAQATTTTMPTRNDFEQIAGNSASQPAVTTTTFTDDGVTYTSTPDVYPPDSFTPVQGSNAYTAYANYSFNPNPADSAIITAYLNNSSTITSNNPTVPRIFTPATYVQAGNSSAGVWSSVSVYGNIGSWSRGTTPVRS